MADGRWSEVDDYLVTRLVPAAPAMEAALAANAAAGLPPHDVSPTQGRFLYLMARLTGARRILEIGTLGGYSTIWLARALEAGGLVVGIEANPHHAEIAAPISGGPALTIAWSCGLATRIRPCRFWRGKTSARST